MQIKFNFIKLCCRSIILIFRKKKKKLRAKRFQSLQNKYEKTQTNIFNNNTFWIQNRLILRVLKNKIRIIVITKLKLL